MWARHWTTQSSWSASAASSACSHARRAQRLSDQHAIAPVAARRLEHQRLVPSPGELEQIAALSGGRVVRRSDSTRVQSTWRWKQRRGLVVEVAGRDLGIAQDLPAALWSSSAPIELITRFSRKRVRIGRHVDSLPLELDQIEHAVVPVDQIHPGVLVGRPRRPASGARSGRRAASPSRGGRGGIPAAAAARRSPPARTWARRSRPVRRGGRWPSR